eukprot:NODE_5499_length_646_cov_303.913295_g5335_i0.p1 GENE.NODE_5499_length_646_cov_303.913295_g5335_i0~~NODE_5499_length_646_cov_303.913295_g5335_i0.p1  ORF type:complete len:167 (+),score=29.34 NODE_5499_length_646_cov_303.913295_g5335_i0:92-592(+)
MKASRTFCALLSSRRTSRNCGGHSNLYNKLHGNRPDLYAEMVYGLNESRDLLPHSTDPAHPLLTRWSDGNDQGLKPFTNSYYDLFMLAFYVYGFITLITFLNYLKTPKRFQYAFEVLTLQYQYEREFGQEYYIKFPFCEPVFLRNPLEKLGLVTGYRNDLDFPDDL